MTQTAPRDRTATARRRGAHAEPPRRRRARPVEVSRPVESRPAETWGDMRERHRRERHEAHLATAAALNELDQAVRRAERWCARRECELDAAEHRFARARATLVH